MQQSTKLCTNTPILCRLWTSVINIFCFQPGFGSAVTLLSPCNGPGRELRWTRNVGCGITYLISTLPVKFLGKENYWKRNTLYRNLFLFFPPGNRAEALAVRTTKPCKGLSVLRQEGNGSRCCLSCLLPHAFYSCPFIFRGSIIIWTPVTASLLIAIQAQQLNET